MVNEARILSPEHAKRARLCNATRSERRKIARERVRRPLQDVGNISQHEFIAQFGQETEHATLIYSPFDENFNIERFLNAENQWIYREGDYSKVERGCLSVKFRYPELNLPIAQSFLSLYFGKCLVHSLGGFEYECQKCKALCWKVEGKTIRNFVGKYCCGSGKTILQPLLEPPDELKHLLQLNTSVSRKFSKAIRIYNNALAFASLGAHIDDRFTRGKGVYTFRIHGQVHHNIGPLLPAQDNTAPRYAQLYFFDTEHELQNRLHCLSNKEEETVLHNLQNMMHQHNPYAQVLKSVGGLIQNVNNCDISMIIKENRSNGWQYLAPRGSEVAAIMPGQGDECTLGQRDILLNLRNGGLKRISNIHRAYMPLVYVLLFPKGEDGWHPLLRVTQKDYYAYRLQIRDDTTQCLLRGGRLFQQYVVDAFSSMEESRLLWMRNNQTLIRAELYKGLVDMVERRDTANQLNGLHVGKRVVLPSSFIGGPRYMHQLYQDSMAIVRKKGKPDLFITFTCNPKWNEIKDALLPGQDTTDRPEIVSRVFYQNFLDLMHLLIKTSIFGDVVGHVAVIEFQKRGLPHAHILLILASRHKPNEVNEYDKIVCAELPNKEIFPELYDIISTCNVHGPCGNYHINSPCMIEGKCRFKYPRRFCANTTLDQTGYPVYRRTDNGHYILRKEVKMDNRWIVPYSPFLSMRYNAHINVEICSTISAVKYLYKYIYKGHDRATIVMQNVDEPDEVKNYLDARYVSASEAAWRIYGFDLHQEKPDVQRLQVHLPYENNVFFRDNDDLRNIVDNESNKKTTLTEWFVTNCNFSSANNERYIDFPEKWVWDKTKKCWTERQKGNCIGRMYNVLPTAGDVYYLRILLTVCKGSKSYEDVRTFNGCTYPTFKDACNARGMLQNDDEWEMCLNEASLICCGKQLRELFAIILVYCMPISPENLWERFCTDFYDDHFRMLINCGHDHNICHNMANNRALSDLNSILQVHGKTLEDFDGMPQIDRTQMHFAENTFLAEELMFDANEQLSASLAMESVMNVGQHDAFYKVMQAVEDNTGDVFFLDGPGGSGKTFLYNALLSRIRAQHKIALACASSGIAALLLHNGRTAHSRFKIPIDVTNTSTCSIKVNSVHAELLKQASLIIWDEAPMINRYAFEAVDRTMRDIMQKSDSLFGGKVMLLGGDFRQVLPVIVKGRREDVVNASLCHSFMWRHIKVLRLTENMRLVNISTLECERDFAKWVLDIGNGSVDNVDEEIRLPRSMLLEDNSLQSLIDFIYADLTHIDNFVDFFKNRGILAPKNKEVDAINDLTLCKLRGETKEFLSADSICSSDDQIVHLYTIEFLNSIDLGGGFPSHILKLKENAPVMLLRNLDPRRGLCNGTRLICKHLHEKVIEARIITGKNVGDIVMIPRIDFISSTSSGLPFEMRRRQFPIKLAFGMTINKAQGQTLDILGLYLASPVFSHGQLYVAMSRVRSSNAIKIVVDDMKLERVHTTIISAKTTNIVYKEILNLANASM